MPGRSIEEYDVLVIGAGPGGEGAAIQAAKEGLRVAVVDELPRVGGNCTHLGTIPSKSLRHAANKLIKRGKENAQNRQSVVRFSQLFESAERVIDSQVDVRAGHYFRNEIEVIIGKASFVDAHTLDVHSQNGQEKTLIGRSIVIA